MVMRWDPLNEMTSLRQAMDQLFENSVIRPSSAQGSVGIGLPIDVIEQGDTLAVKASLPGVTADDVNITIQNNVLTISGEQREEKTGTSGRYLYRERRAGSFSRAIALPVAVNADACEATFTDGVLTLTLPKAEQARTKQIPVRTQHELKAGEVKSTNGQQTQSAAPATAGRG